MRANPSFALASLLFHGFPLLDIANYLRGQPGRLYFTVVLPGARPALTFTVTGLPAGATAILSFVCLGRISSNQRHADHKHTKHSRSKI